MGRVVRWVAGALLLAACCTLGGPDIQTVHPPTSPPSSTDSTAALALLLQGRSCYRARDLLCARDLFRKGARTDPVLADYHLYLLARTEIALGKYGDASRTFTRLLREMPDSVWARDAALRAARLANRRGHDAEASRLLSTILRDGSPTDRAAVEAALLLASVQERGGKYENALSHYRRIRRHAPPAAAARARARADRLQDKAGGDLAPPSPTTLIEEMELRSREGDRPGVEEIARQWDDRFRQHPLRPRVLLLRARTADEGEAPADADRLWWAIVEQYPASREAPLALFTLARALWNRDEDKAAAQLFHRFLRTYPRHSLGPEALYALGRIHQQARRWRAARSAYTRLMHRYPHSRLADEAAWRRAWLAYLAGDHERAAAEFGAVAALGGETADEALYWQARSLEASRGPGAAAALYLRVLSDYPRGYYAFWAERRAPVTVRSARTPEEGASPPPLARPPGLAPAAAEHLARYQALRTLGWAAWARRELDATLRHLDGRPRTLLYVAEQYVAVRGYRASLRMATRLEAVAKLDPEVRSQLDRLLYPRGYWRLIEREAARQSLDPYLVAALIRQESLFDPRARSPKNARGLIQILPQTAARVAKDGPPTPDDLFDPRRNVPLATAHLRRLIDRYDGSWVKALAAYNAGEAAVAKWEARTREAPADVFVEEISYRETRQFVKRVLRHYRTYRSIYTPGVPTPPGA